MRGRVGIAAWLFVVAAACAALAAPEPPRASGAIHGNIVPPERDGVRAGHSVKLLRDGAPPRTATTDEAGRFEFDGVDPGEPYEVRLDETGFATVRVPGVVVLAGERRGVGALALGDPQALRVKVVDERGRPIEGATVDVFRESEGPLGEYVERACRERLPEPLHTAPTDATGETSFRLSPKDTWTVAAQAPGRARVARPRVDRYDGKRMEVLLQLPPASRLAGRVVDDSGRPAPHALVLARRYVPMVGDCGTCDPPHWSAALWTRADADAAGRFVLDALPPGRIEIVAAPRGGAASYVCDVEVPTVREFDFTLHATSRIVGRANDEATGAPVAGAVVAAKSGRSVETACIAVTGADGSCVLDGIACDDGVEMELVPPRGWVRARGGFGLARDQKLRPGRDARFAFTLTRGATVTGRALRDGKPVPGADIEVVTLPADLDGYVPGFANGRADAEGRYRVEGVLPGRLVICATDPVDDDGKTYDAFYESVVKTEAGRAKHAFDAAPGAVVERDAEVRPSPPKEKERPSLEEMEKQIFGERERPVVQGIVTSSDGVVVCDAQVQIEAGKEVGAHDTEWPVGLDGTYAGPVYPEEGEEQVTVRVRDLLHDVVTRTVAIKKGAARIDVDVELPPRPLLRGRVVSGGAPVAGALLYHRGAAIGRTGADGTFAVPLATGTAELGVEARGSIRREFKDVTVPAETPCELELEPALAIAGVVVDEKGAAVSGVRVTPTESGGDAILPYFGWWYSWRRSAAVTGADGRFRLDEIPAGSHVLRIESEPGEATQVATFLTDPVAAGTSDARFVTRVARRIAGRIVRADGRPMGEARITCTPLDDGEKREARTNDGRFAFDRLGDGEYRLDIVPGRRSGFCPARRVVKAGATDLVVELVAAQEIAGVVVTPDGKPCERKSIEATRLDTPGADEPEWPWDFEQWIEEDGAFRITVPPGARFRIGPARRTRESDTHVLKGGEDVASGSKDLRLVFTPAGLRIEGVVVDPSGKPLEGATIEASAYVADTRTVRSGADGKFVLEGLSPRHATLKVRLDGRALALRFGVLPGTPGVRFVMRPPLTISGRLLGAKGAPETARRIRAVSPAFAGIDEWRATPDAEGRFEIRGLDEGEWILQAFTPKGDAAEDAVTLGTFKAGAQDVELRIPE